MQPRYTIFKIAILRQVNKQTNVWRKNKTKYFFQNAERKINLYLEFYSIKMN